MAGFPPTSFGPPGANGGSGGNPLFDMFGGLLGGDGSAMMEGADLLSMALGRGDGPGGGDLDEFVHFEIFYDGTAKAVEAGEAVAFLRSKLCQVFELLDSDLRKHLWHRDPFCVEVSLGSDLGKKNEVEPHLVGHVRTGECMEDVWFVIYLLRRLTQLQPDASCRVVDADGEVLLIEAALVVPRWLSEDVAPYRCWLRGGEVHLLPKPRPPEPFRLPAKDGLARLRSADVPTRAKDKVQAAIATKLQGFPAEAVEHSTHFARAVLPKSVAQLLLAFPQLVAVALDHLPPPPAAELQRLRKSLSDNEKSVCFDCEGQPSGSETVCVGLRLTQLQYARYRGLRCQLGQRFTAKHWKQPPAANIEEKAMLLGSHLAAGLEVAYLQSTSSAVAALRWPSVEALLPEGCPWFADDAFSRHHSSSSSSSGGGGSSSSSSSSSARPNRQAYFQQSFLEEPFRAALQRVLAEKGLANLDVSLYWRDTSDAEEWLDISPEDLDQQMAGMQAEFDAFDKKRGAKHHSESSKKGDPTEAEAQKTAEEAMEELASGGKALSELLAKASSHDGIDAKSKSDKTGDCSCCPGDATSSGCGNKASKAEADSSDSDDDSEDGELDVLGMEEDFDAPSSDDDDDDGDEDDDEEGQHGAHQLPNGAGGDSAADYMAELDEQLEDILDGGAAAQEDEQGQGMAPKSEGLQLSSKHVKVHGADRVELDLHAMEHIVASYCAENAMEPGAASVLLGELGLGMGGSRGGRSSTRPRMQEAPMHLDEMD